MLYIYIYVGWMGGWGGMVIIGYRSSESTFVAEKYHLFLCKVPRPTEPM